MAIIFRLLTLVTAIANINLFISDTFFLTTKKLISLDLFFLTETILKEFLLLIVIFKGKRPSSALCAILKALLFYTSK